MEVEDSQLPTQGMGQLGVGDFVTEGLHVKLTLTSDGMSWTALNSKKSVSVVLEWCDVIRCHRGKVSAKNPMEIQEVTDKEPCFTVHYIEKQEDHVWKHKHTTFQSSHNNFDDILSTVCEKYKKDHPGRLLVVINPAGGTGKGEAQYTRVIAPLFKLAQIETDVKVSQNPQQPGEIGETYDFSQVDGVVIVGGDGTFQQLIHTWSLRLQREAGQNLEKPEITLKPLNCSIGIIPTGTGNGLARFNYGNMDLATAALNIISGRKLSKSLLRVKNGTEHFRFSGVFVGFGKTCDFLDTALESRWLGWFRYPLGTIATFVRKRREFYLRLEYLPYESPTITEGSSVDQSTSDPDWVTVEGYYTGVLCLPGLAIPNETTGRVKLKGDSEGLSLLLEKQCGRIKFYRWMYKMYQFRNDMLTDDFITTKQVKAFKFQIIQKEGENKSERELHLEKHINLDGEIRRLEDPEISVRNHPHLMEMYGTAPLF